MEQTDTKKTLEFEIGENVEIIPLGEVTYAGRAGERLEFVRRPFDCVIASLFINDEQIYYGDGKFRVRGEVGFPRLMQKGIDESYETKDEILKRAGR